MNSPTLNSPVANGLIFGIDLGIASCGWAVLRHPTETDPTGAIEAMGSWMFDVPETDKERTPTNQIRRGNRLLRRVVRRRAQRMATIRRRIACRSLPNWRPNTSSFTNCRCRPASTW